MGLSRQKCGGKGNVQSECDPKVANVVNSKYGPNSANQMWSTFGKNVAQLTKAQSEGKPNVVHIHYIAKSFGSRPSNERFDYFSNFHEYKS